MHDLILYYECHNVVKVALDKSVSSAMNYHEIFCVGDATRVFAVEPAEQEAVSSLQLSVC